MPSSQETLQEIQELKFRYDELSKGKEEFLEKCNQEEIFLHVYNSNAIENNSLDILETQNYLAGKKIGRSVRNAEKFEAKNLKKATLFLYEYIKENKGKKLDNKLILDLHKILMKNIWDDIAGKFRQKNENVRVGVFIAPEPSKILNLLKKTLDDFYTQNQENIVKRITKFHLDFEHVHPFCDGNGRIGRLLNNFCLISLGYPPIIIPFEYRENYYWGFQDFQGASRDTGRMEGFMMYCIKTSLESRIS